MAGEVRALWTRARKHLGAIRVRTTAAAVLVVGVSLVIASVALVSFLERSLRSHVRMTARIHAEAVADDLRSELNTGVLVVGESDEEFVQVIAADRQRPPAQPQHVRPAARHPAGARRGAGPRVRPVRGQPENEPDEDEPFLAVAISSTSADLDRSRWSSDAAWSRRPRPPRAVKRVLGIAVPLLLLVVGAVTWGVVGRALAPVDAISEEVDAISSKELHRRVPDPPGSRRDRAPRRDDEPHARPIGGGASSPTAIRVRRIP